MENRKIKFDAKVRLVRRSDYVFNIDLPEYGIDAGQIVKSNIDLNSKETLDEIYYATVDGILDQYYNNHSFSLESMTKSQINEMDVVKNENVLIDMSFELLPPKNGFILSETFDNLCGDALLNKMQGQICYYINTNYKKNMELVLAFSYKEACKYLLIGSIYDSHKNKVNVRPNIPVEKILYGSMDWVNWLNICIGDEDCAMAMGPFSIDPNFPFILIFGGNDGKWSDFVNDELLIYYRHKQEKKKGEKQKTLKTGVTSRW